MRMMRNSKTGTILDNVLYLVTSFFSLWQHLKNVYAGRNQGNNCQVLNIRSKQMSENLLKQLIS